jgi:hypothetical protein
LSGLYNRIGAEMIAIAWPSHPRHAASKFMTLRAALAVLIVCTPALAHDNGQFDNVSPAVRTWLKNVKSPHGIPCCDIADGHRTEFDMRQNQYWVPINGDWLPVPPEAVLTDVDNPIGEAVVWYTAYGGRVLIRCFVPGSGT